MSYLSNAVEEEGAGFSKRLNVVCEGVCGVRVSHTF